MPWLSPCHKASRPSPIPTIVEPVYKKLLSYEITAEEFVLRQTGYDGVAPTNLEELELKHPMVKFQRGFLKGYLRKLVVVDYDDLRTRACYTSPECRAGGVALTSMVSRSTLIKWVLCPPVSRSLLIGNIYSPLLNPHSTLTCKPIHRAEKPGLCV